MIGNVQVNLHKKVTKNGRYTQLLVILFHKFDYKMFHQEASVETIITKNVWSRNEFLEKSQDKTIAWSCLGIF